MDSDIDVEDHSDAGSDDTVVMDRSVRIGGSQSNVQVPSLQQNGAAVIIQFDTTLPGSHSYLPGLSKCLSGRSDVGPGWEGVVPCWQHQSIIFPGESLPMVCIRTTDSQQMQEIIDSTKLFGLLCPEDVDKHRSYGLLCEIFEYSEPTFEINHPRLSFKARAMQRFILTSKIPPLLANRSMINCNVRILPDVVLEDPLIPAGLRSLDKFRDKDNYGTLSIIRRADAAFTAWPLSVYETLNVKNMIELIRKHFHDLHFDSLPLDVLSLSYWVAANLSLTFSERFLLFTIDNAVLRLYLEVQHIKRLEEKSALCCESCMTEIANRKDIIIMTSEGLRSNFCNPGGYIHDTLTVSAVTNVVLRGYSSSEFSWFPGYKWTVAECRCCESHLGWRFDARDKNLQPSFFWGLSQQYLTSPNTRLSTPYL